MMTSLRESVLTISHSCRRPPPKHRNHILLWEKKPKQVLVTREDGGALRKFWGGFSNWDVLASCCDGAALSSGSARLLRELRHNPSLLKDTWKWLTLFDSWGKNSLESSASCSFRHPKIVWFVDLRALIKGTSRVQREPWPHTRCLFTSVKTRTMWKFRRRQFVVYRKCLSCDSTSSHLNSLTEYNFKLLQLLFDFVLHGRGELVVVGGLVCEWNNVSKIVERSGLLTSLNFKTFRMRIRDLTDT